MPSVEFPFILSGPLIRRAEPTQVFFWMATSKRCNISPTLFKISGTPDQPIYEKIHADYESSRVRIGKRLFIHLIKAFPTTGLFPTDTLIGYNLKFFTGSDMFDLSRFGFLSKESPQSIVYGSLKYPAFLLKGPSNVSNILYGSCRKLHGKGTDTLALGDMVLENEYFNLSSRPDSLFLMGDQIYADDVADPIFRTISFLNKELIGDYEPLEKIDDRIQLNPFHTSLKRINGRQYIMENFCQFTSGNAQNHLIELGEFAAMYLLSWSPQIWEFARSKGWIETFNEAVSSGYIHFTFPVQTKEHRAERNQLESRFNEQVEALVSFQKTLPQVQRLLANIPSYMIFDDHDVTDDWNITSNWRRNVETSPLGRHVIANGLTAYWAFQGWGNHPDSFDEHFRTVMKSYFKRLRTRRIHSVYEKWVSLVWNFNSWHYISPTHPRAVFLDSRTQREYNNKPSPVKFGEMIEEEIGCPQLLSKSGWELVSEKLKESSWEKNRPLIIVAATPVYGMGLIESFIHDYVYPFKVLGVEVQTSFDFEAWKYNAEGFTEFLEHVADWSPSPCIILSGDVHYATAVKAEVTFQDGRELKINQFTSSPFKNMSFAGLWGLLMKGVIGVNVRNRKNKDLLRYCSEEYEIKRGTSEHYLWKDQLRYQTVKKDSIFETQNNMGFLFISGEEIRNNLLT
jgi:hypothetical protein